VTRIYLDPTSLVLAHGGPDAVDEHVAPGAADAVQHLLDAGYDVVLLGDPPPVATEELPSAVTHAGALPDHLDADAWYLTGDAHPAFGRPRGGTSVLVGPKLAPGAFPPPRFDLEVRDLASAAMEILTREAMA
jgi:hypothetical protein